MLEPGERITHRGHVRLIAYVPAAAFLVLLMMPGRIMGLVSTELAITDKRVLGKIGIFRRRYLKLLHRDIEVAIAQRSLLGLMFNYGSVTISGKSGVRIKFRGIRRPHELVRDIDKAAEIAVLGGALLDDDELDKKIANYMRQTAPAEKTFGRAVQPPMPADTLPLKEEAFRHVEMPKAHKDPDSW